MENMTSNQTDAYIRTAFTVFFRTARCTVCSLANAGEMQSAVNYQGGRKDMQKITCCQNCAERHPACHDTCEVYRQQKRIQEADKETRRKNSAPDRQIYQHKAETIRKIKK